MHGSSFLARMRRSRRRHWTAALRDDQRGSTAVEFAFIAPIFFFLMFVIAETALIFIAEQVMDNAVFEAARLVRTGQAQQGTWPNPDPEADPAPMTPAQFKQLVCGRMSVFINCNSPQFYLEAKSFDTFVEVRDYLAGRPVDDEDAFQAEGAYEFGGAAEIVVVRAYYQWPTNPIYGSLTLANMDNGKRLIGSFAAFRNEPYEAN